MPAESFAAVDYLIFGNREDLSDMVYRIDPTDTPFMTGAEKEKASAVNHEWQTQALAAASGSNAQLEGDDPTTNTTTPTIRLGNICQISYKVARCRQGADRFLPGETEGWQRRKQDRGGSGSRRDRSASRGRQSDHAVSDRGDRSLV